MKNQTKAALFCAVLITILLGDLLIFAFRRSRFDAIHIGMTPNQVRNLLGKPGGGETPLRIARPDFNGAGAADSLQPDYSWWTEEWNDPDENTKVTYINGKVAEIDRTDWKE